MNKLFQDKKGQDESAGSFVMNVKFHYYLIAVFIILFALIYYVSYLTSYADSYAPVPDNLKDDLLFARIVNVCFAYQNPELGIIRQNVLDKNILDINRLQQCFDKSSTKALEVSFYEIDESKPFQTLKMGNVHPSKSFVRYALLKTDTEIKPILVKVST